MAELPISHLYPGKTKKNSKLLNLFTARKHTAVKERFQSKFIKILSVLICFFMQIQLHASCVLCLQIYKQKFHEFHWFMTLLDISLLFKCFFFPLYIHPQKTITRLFISVDAQNFLASLIDVARVSHILLTMRYHWLINSNAIKLILWNQLDSNVKKLFLFSFRPGLCDILRNKFSLQFFFLIANLKKLL
jgi:hypothetical protein